ncbi:OmpW/AlkL family protein [Microbulbifer halophilus]|uniref:OmpW family protein n=1 Tax=Microbulbifer halophilus TaxID=453963 RepID=A0ABW5EE37_9GAMM|nr:OmpW family outer membrane protein [Microbulbifer halophilus]MCW8127672.1 OmpW family protein [Microbulbifer halophilus]
MKVVILCAAALAAVLASAQVLAEYEKSSVLVRIGAGWEAPDNGSNWLRLHGTELADPPAMDSGATPTLPRGWLLTGQRTLPTAIPLDHDRGVSTSPYSPTRSGFKQLAPVLTMQWYPVYSESRVQPYVGLGVRYITVVDETAASRGRTTAFGVVGDTRPEAGDSWGATGEMGVDITLGRDSRWWMNAAVWYLDGDAKIRLPANDDAKRIENKLDEDPWAYSVGVGYRF